MGDFDRGSIPEPSPTRCQIESVVIVDLAGSLSFFVASFLGRGCGVLDGSRVDSDGALSQCVTLLADDAKRPLDSGMTAFEGFVPVSTGRQVHADSHPGFKQRFCLKSPTNSSEDPDFYRDPLNATTRISAPKRSCKRRLPANLT